jgi:hypothetical protein
MNCASIISSNFLIGNLKCTLKAIIPILTRISRAFNKD